MSKVVEDAAATPADLIFDCQPFDIAFHPSADVLAVGLVSGAVHLIALGGAPRAGAGSGSGAGGRGGGVRRLRVTPHTGAVRALAFNAAGDGASSAAAAFLVALNSVNAVDSQPAIKDVMHSTHVFLSLFMSQRCTRCPATALCARWMRLARRCGAAPRRTAAWR